MSLREILEIVKLDGQEIYIKKEGKVLWNGFNTADIPKEVLTYEVEKVFPTGCCETFSSVFVILK